jgi:hypothetical protein
MKSEMQSAMSATTAQVLQDSLILSVEFRRYGIQRGIETEELSESANPEMIRVSKQILTSEEYDAIGSLDGEVRRFIEIKSAPSPFKKGTYLFAPPDTDDRRALLEDVDSTLEDYRFRRRILVDRFMEVYLGKVEEAQQTLGTFFRRSDYHEESYVRNSFRMYTRWLQVTVPVALASLSPAILEREELKARRLMEETAEEIQSALRESMQRLVARMVDRLTPDADGKKKRFYDSTIANVTEFLDTFSARNITGDQPLAALVEKAKAVLAGVGPDDVRSNEGMRDAIRKNFESVDKALEGLVKRPSRRITLDEKEEAQQ